MKNIFFFQVYLLGAFNDAGGSLPSHHHPQPKDARLPPLHQVQTHPPRGHQHHRQKVLRRRLVSVLHARTER